MNFLRFSEGELRTPLFSILLSMSTFSCSVLVRCSEVWYVRHDQHLFHPTHYFSCYGHIAIVAVALSMDTWPKYIMDADEIINTIAY